jgi:RNA polymerase sigma factor (TIGR02999 family)
LDAVERGEALAAEDLLPLVYEELRRLAASQMAHEKAGQTLQATALVHEAWLRLTGSDAGKWANSRHFFNAAAEAMRRILVDNARRKSRPKHGGHLQRVAIEQVDVATQSDEGTVLAVNEALAELETHDPLCASLVKLRYFAGLRNDQAARLLGLSERTATRNWAYARAWLAQRLKRSL